MKLVEINAVPYGSTGKIMYSIADAVNSNNGSATCFTSFTWQKSNRADSVIVSGFLQKGTHMTAAKLLGVEGRLSVIATCEMIKKIKQINPDVIQMHNIHGWYLNLPILFNFLKTYGKPVVWTLHDCWAFTGHCPHYDMIGCTKWQTECRDCSQHLSYPKSITDNSQKMFYNKKEWFTGVDNLTIVTPSQWLAENVKKSFLGGYPVRVINNGIDLSVFNKLDSKFREEKGVSSDKHLILGVAYDWGIEKGLDVFAELSRSLDSEQYQIVLVGTNETAEKQLPQNIITVDRTQNPRELAEIYSAADLFVNPTREDTYPTVNMEAIACGTPIVTFNTGGSPETLDNTCGSVVPKDDIEALKSEIVRICEQKPYSYEACLERARSFDECECYHKYYDLYMELIDDTTAKS